MNAELQIIGAYMRPRWTLGISAEVMSIRVDEDRRRKLAELQVALAPLVRSRTHLVILMIDLTHAMVFTWGMLQVVMDGVQRLLGVTRYYEELPRRSAEERHGVAETEISPTQPRGLRNPLLLSPRDAGRGAVEMAWATSLSVSYKRKSQVANAWVQ